MTVKNNSENRGDNSLSVTIQTTQGNWDNSFPKTTKAQDVINSTVQHFGYSPKGTYELRLESNPNETLQPDRPLVSYGIKDGDILIFTDLGIAV